MLVFQLNWEEHIKNNPEKGCKRAGINFKWLVEVVAEINLYLPDDWRMTRSTNNFRINIVSDDHSVALVGHSFRTNGDEILNIIDSVHKKEYIDTVDLKRETERKKGKLDASLKKKNPHAPNLYFFRPCPPNSDTPLFARQYERIKKTKEGAWTGDQYHRIHPLTKAGLDLTHFRWVRWTINGDIKEVDTIPSDYHGKDYWKVKVLKGSKKRASRNIYIKEYLRILNIEGVVAPKPSEKAPTPYEIEYKFFVPGTSGDSYKTFELIEEHKDKKISGFTIIDGDTRTKRQTDTYFDDDILSLHGAGASFRVRHKKDAIWVTLKKRLPAQKGYSEAGLYQRIEKEAVITSEMEKKLRAGESINVFPYLLLPYIAPYCTNLRPIVDVINNRKTLILDDSDHRKAELCLDEIRYIINGKTYGPYFEIEIESKGVPRDQIKKLADYLEEELGLLPLQQSKYERGISILKTAEVPKEKKKVIIDTDCGVDDALALILALKSPELDVLAITTVSGNVHVNAVNTNVFKVLKELNLKNLPLVAKGADKPLKIDPIEAESVHGKDGLGDIQDIQHLDIMTFDERPAWKLICDLARENPKEITIITIGPLTNLALAIRNDPESVHCLKKVVSMGGVFFDVGNVAPDAEFNVGADPHAACDVVEFCRDSCLKIPVNDNNELVHVPPKPKEDDFKEVKRFLNHDPDDPDMVAITFVGLDVTHKVVLRSTMLDRVVKAHPKNDLLKFIHKISKKYMDFYYKNEGLKGCYLHDPLAVAYVINPAFLEIKKHIIRVETAGNFTSGMIYPDDRPTTNRAWRNPAEEVIGVAQKVEKEAFEEFFLNRIVSNPKSKSLY